MIDDEINLTLSNTKRKEAIRETQVKLYRVMVMFILLYINAGYHVRQIRTLEITFTRSVEGCIREDRIRSETIYNYKCTTNAYKCKVTQRKGEKPMITEWEEFQSWL